MIINNLNLNYLKIFTAVYRNQSMTVAAKELHMTQSGVSQQIKNLEYVLENSLFERINKKLIPTEKARLLYDNLSTDLGHIESTLVAIQDKEQPIQGVVRIGMPSEFGINIIQPLLAKLGNNYPHIQFVITMGLAPELTKLILNGQLDFAFTDGILTESQITTKKVFNEGLLLCCSEKYKNQINVKKINKKSYEAYDYIAYDESAMVLSNWFKYHLKAGKMNLNIKAVIDDSYSILNFITNHFGIGVIPDHLHEKALKNGHKLYIFKGNGRLLKNSVQLSLLKKKQQTPASQMTIDFLIDEVTKLA